MEFKIGPDTVIYFDVGSRVRPSGESVLLRILGLDRSGNCAPDLPEINLVRAANVPGAARFLPKKVDPLCPEAIQEILDNPGKLYQMDGHQFEDLVAGICRNRGYTVTQTKRSHDGGVDMVIEKTIDGMRHTYIVQCKHVENPRRRIGVRVARELMGALQEWCTTAAILVTNALFTRDALQYAARQASRLFCWDRFGLLGLMKAALR